MKIKLLPSPVRYTEFFAYKSSTRIALNRTRSRLLYIDLYNETIAFDKNVEESRYHFSSFDERDGWIKITADQFFKDFNKISNKY